MTGQVGGFQNPEVCLQAFPSFLPHPLPALLLVPFFARSLSLIPRSFLLNCTETLATQATNSSKNFTRPNNRIHLSDCKIHSPRAIGQYFLCTLFDFPKRFELSGVDCSLHSAYIYLYLQDWTSILDEDKVLVYCPLFASLFTIYFHA